MSRRTGPCRCGQPNVLVDRTGAAFPLLPAYGHRTEIQNSKPLYLADRPEHRRLGLAYARSPLHHGDSGGMRVRRAKTIWMPRPAAGDFTRGFTNGELNNQMAAWIDARWFWTLLILTLCGEFLLPCLLARKDPAYRPGTMAVSVLGRRGGPVARVYRLWLAWLGIWLLTTAAVYAVGAAPASRWLAAGLAVSLGGFALGAGILAALFPTGLTKDLSDRSALIHGIASALGFFALLFLPLWQALLALETDSPVMAWACFAALGLALVFFTLFVLSDKDRFQGTAVAREGLWEQLCLAAMYVPLLLDAIVHLISAP